MAERTVLVGATPDLRKTNDGCSLSLRERARVRGNETQPTETAGRILQAQLDRFPESELAIPSSVEPVDGGSAPIRKRRQSKIATLARRIPALSPTPGERENASPISEAPLSFCRLFCRFISNFPENKIHHARLVGRCERVAPVVLIADDGGLTATFLVAVLDDARVFVDARVGLI